MTSFQSESRGLQSLFHPVFFINSCAARVAVHKGYEMRLGLLLLLLLLLSMLSTTGCSAKEELPVTSAVFPERSSVTQKQSVLIISSSFYLHFHYDNNRFAFLFPITDAMYYEM